MSVCLSLCVLQLGHLVRLSITTLFSFICLPPFLNLFASFNAPYVYPPIPLLPKKDSCLFFPILNFGKPKAKEYIGRSGRRIDDDDDNGGNDGEGGAGWRDKEASGRERREAGAALWVGDPSTLRQRPTNLPLSANPPRPQCSHPHLRSASPPPSLSLFSSSSSFSFPFPFASSLFLTPRCKGMRLIFTQYI